MCEVLQHFAKQKHPRQLDAFVFARMHLAKSENWQGYAHKRSKSWCLVFIFTIEI